MKAKTHLSQAKSRGGFTLVEMLVVIGMIAALAGLSFPVYRGIQKKVDDQRADMAMNAIEGAVENFVTEYNYYPYIGSSYPTTESWLDRNSGHSTALITVLAGLNNSSYSCNFKRIKFLELWDPKNGKNGMEINTTNQTAKYFTPWGVEIRHFRFDYNEDGMINVGYGLGDQPIGFIILDEGPDGGWYGNDDWTNYDHLRVNF